MTQRDRWANRPVVERYHIMKDAIREALPDYVMPVHLKIDFYIPMPKSYGKRKRALLEGTLHTQKPDIDNLCKGFMDAFKTKEGKTADDSRVAILEARKFWSEEGYILVY